MECPLDAITDEPGAETSSSTPQGRLVGFALGLDAASCGEKAEYDERGDPSRESSSNPGKWAS